MSNHKLRTLSPGPCRLKLMQALQAGLRTSSSRQPSLSSLWRALICGSAVICGPGSEMDRSEEDQKVAAPWSLKRSFSSFSCGTCVRCSDARARRARRSALRRQAQPSNKEGLEDPTLETPLKDTGLPPSPPAPPIDGRTLFDLEVALTIAKGLAPDEDLHEALLDHMKAEAEVSPEGLATLAQPLADKTTTDKTSPILNDLGPVALPRIGKKERFSKPCPRHCQAGRKARPHQYLSKPNNCGCCVGTCELCTPPKPQWSLTSCNFFHTRCSRSPSFSPTTDSDLAFGADPFGDGAASEDLPQPLARQTPWPSPWPCARCNREPRDTVWRPLDGATWFDTEERICGACWVEPESQPDSEGEPFHCELCPHCGCDPAMLE